MTELDGLIAEAELGDEAKRFLESDLYRCIVGMAEQEVLAAQEALGHVDPTKSDDIRQFQNQIKLFKTFDLWLKQLVSQGDNAMHIFQHARDT